MRESVFSKAIADSIAIKTALLGSEAVQNLVEQIIQEVVSCYANGGKVLFCGNGGSAADAQHLAGELSGRFYLSRPSLWAEALHVNTSYVTAVANDFGFDVVFSRLIEGIGRPGDILFALSTSGNSPNVVNAVLAANELNMITVGFTGQDGGRLNTNCRFLFKVPSNEVPRIQEMHLFVGHIICQEVEKRIFGK